MNTKELKEEYPDGSILFEIEVVINNELQREILGFANGVKVLSPDHLVETIKMKLKRAAKNYEKGTE